MTDLSGTTEQDLRAAFDAVVDAPPTHPGRLSEVQGRVRRVRRRRSATAATLAVLAVAGSAALVTRFGAPSPNQLAGHQYAAPEYRSGGKLIVSAFSESPDGTQVTFTPTSTDLQFASTCVTDRPAPTLDLATDSTMQILVNGEEVSSGGCEAGVAPDSFGNSFAPGDGGAPYFTVGQPVTVRIQPVPGKSPHATGWGLAVYQGVPLNQYVFPPAPTPIPSLDMSGNIGDPNLVPVMTVRGTGQPRLPDDLYGTTRQEEMKVTLHQGLEVALQATVPGDVDVSVNGRIIWSPATWTYNDESAVRWWTLKELGVAPGETVVIGITAHRYLGQTWHVVAFDTTQG